VTLLAKGYTYFDLVGWLVGYIQQYAQISPKSQLGVKEIRNESDQRQDQYRKVGRDTPKVRKVTKGERSPPRPPRSNLTVRCVVDTPADSDVGIL
jgi:hypothetical protein